MGDWHHHRSTINIETLHYSLAALEKLSAAFANVYFIVGNHDMYNKNKRDVNSVEWAKNLPNIHLIDSITTIGDTTLCPFLIGDEWRQLIGIKSKYLMGHFELPHFILNAQIEMPDHGELQRDHIKQFEYVFSGHFHKRQHKDNVIYIGNSFPHNFSDAGDDERGMMILEWGGIPEFKSWPLAPKYRIHNLSDILESPEKLLLPHSYVRVNLDIELSYEESQFLRETLVPQYGLREMTLIPIKADLTTDVTDYSNSEFESVDTIIERQIGELQEGAFDRKLLLEIYRNL